MNQRTRKTQRLIGFSQILGGTVIAAVIVLYAVWHLFNIGDFFYKLF